MGRKVSELLVEINAKTDKLKKGLNQSEKQVSKFGKGVARLGAMVAGAFAVSRVSAFAMEVSNLAGEMEGVENAFKRIADQQTLEDLQKATRGTVSELELMKRAVMASNFQLPVEQLASLFEFASRRAQETGQSVDYLVNSIVLGIGRKSPLILDNLGISAIRLRKELKGTGVEMTTVADVAAAVGKIATEEMSKMGDSIVTSKDQTAQFGAEWQNVKVEIGGVVNAIKGELNPTLTKSLGYLKEIIRFRKNIIETVTKGKAAQAELNQKTYENYNWWEKIKFAIGISKKAISSASDAMEEYNETGVDESAALEESISTTTEAIKEQKQSVEDLTSALNAFAQAQWDANSAQRGVDRSGEAQKEQDALASAAKQKKEQQEEEKKREEDLMRLRQSNLAQEIQGYAMSMAAGATYADGMKNIMKDIISMFINQGIAALVSNAMISAAATGPFGFLAAAALGSIAGGIAKAAFSGIDSFAEGGIVTGPQLAMVGDNPSGREAIIPLEKMGSMMGGQTIKIQGRLVANGRDLVSVFDEQNAFAGQVY